MRALLLPVKDLINAKRRLQHVFSPEERLALAEAMLADTIRTLGGVRRAEKIFVATNCQAAINAAEENGWEILREARQVSESDSVDEASRICERRGVRALLRVPLDLPLMHAADLDELLAVECQPPAVVIVPSRDGTGTNAMLRTPPTLFPSHFGEGSFAKHLTEAERAGAYAFIRRNPRLEMDLDDEADMRALLDQDLRGTEIGRWLDKAEVAARLRDNKEWPVAAGL